MMERVRNAIHAGAVYCHADNIEARVKVISCHDDKGVYIELLDTQERMYLAFNGFRLNYRRITS